MRSIKSPLSLPLLLIAVSLLLPDWAEGATPPIRVPAGAEVVQESGYGANISWIIKFPDQSAQALVSQVRYPKRLSNFRQYARNLQRGS